MDLSPTLVKGVVEEESGYIAQGGLKLMSFCTSARITGAYFNFFLSWRVHSSKKDDKLLFKAHAFPPC